MNWAGKRVLHLLFIVSAFLSCRACAAYFYDSEKNFKCPICVLLKGVQPNSTLTFPNFINVQHFDVNEKDILSKSKKNSQQNTNNDFKIHQISVSTQIELITDYCQSKYLLSVKRYLLFKQLKIAGFYQFITPMKTKPNNQFLNNKI